MKYRAICRWLWAGSMPHGMGHLREVGIGSIWGPCVRLSTGGYDLTNGARLRVLRYRGVAVHVAWRAGGRHGCVSLVSRWA
ncbi:MAG TPA: hypothetical protein VGK73_32275 [Polyangiaceae bacterium]